MRSLHPDSWDGDALTEFNQCHEPGGSSKGGQFCATPGEAFPPPLARAPLAIQRGRDIPRDSKGQITLRDGVGTKWYPLFRKEFTAASLGAQVTPDEVDLAYEQRAIEAATAEAHAFWTADDADADAIRKRDRDLPGPHPKTPMGVMTVFTFNQKDYGMGSGGYRAAKVFWGPYSAPNRVERLMAPMKMEDGRTRYESEESQRYASSAFSAGVDPIYVLSHELHHGYGGHSEFDLGSDVVALSAHLRTKGEYDPEGRITRELLGNLFNAVAFRSFRYKGRHVRWTPQARALRYLRRRFPTEFEQAVARAEVSPRTYRAAMAVVASLPGAGGVSVHRERRLTEFNKCHEPETGRFCSVAFNSGLKSEARQVGPRGIEIGPKFLRLPPDAQRDVLAHEIGHTIVSRLIADHTETFWALVGSGAFGRWTETSRGGFFDGFGGTFTPEEAMTEGVWRFLSGQSAPKQTRQITDAIGWTPREFERVLSDARRQARGLTEFNKCHEPGGTSKGGQFCSTGGGISAEWLQQALGVSRPVADGIMTAHGQLSKLTWAKDRPYTGPARESAVAVSLHDGRLLPPAVIGEEGGVTFNRGAWGNEPEVVFLHTHPNGGAFSFADFFNLVKDSPEFRDAAKIRHMMALGPDGSAFAFTLRRPAPPDVLSAVLPLYEAMRLKAVTASAKATNELILTTAGYTVLETKEVGEPPMLMTRTSDGKWWDMEAIPELANRHGFEDVEVTFRRFFNPHLSVIWRKLEKMYGKYFRYQEIAGARAAGQAAA